MTTGSVTERQKGIYRVYAHKVMYIYIYLFASLYVYIYIIHYLCAAAA